MAGPENTRGMLIDNCPVTFPAHDHITLRLIKHADQWEAAMGGRQPIRSQMSLNRSWHWIRSFHISCQMSYISLLVVCFWILICRIVFIIYKELLTQTPFKNTKTIMEQSSQPQQNCPLQTVTADPSNQEWCKQPWQSYVKHCINSYKRKVKTCKT